eukprot:Hpha_TRINITY_DN22233_c0_g1::TRINITY_DN22233_c0_g1_i1::g.167278::m.167278
MGNCGSKSPRGSGNGRMKKAPTWIGNVPGTEPVSQEVNQGGVTVGGALPVFLCVAGPTQKGSSVTRHLQFLSGEARLRDWHEKNLGVPFVIAEKQTSRWGIECRVVVSRHDTGVGELTLQPQDLQIMAVLRSLSKRKHMRADKCLYTDCADAAAVGNPQLLSQVSEAGQAAIKAGAHAIATGRSARCAEIYEATLTDLLDNVSVLGPNPVSALGTALVRCDYCTLRSDAGPVHLLCNAMRNAFDQVQAQSEAEGTGSIAALRAAVAVEQKKREHANEYLQEAAVIYFKKVKKERKLLKQVTTPNSPETPSSGAGASGLFDQPDEYPDAPTDLLCPITLMLMRDPVRTPAGIVFEREAITGWLATHGNCPFTRGSLASEDLEDDTEMAGRVDSWISEQTTDAAAADLTTSFRRKRSSMRRLPRNLST